MITFGVSFWESEDGVNASGDLGAEARQALTATAGADRHRRRLGPEPRSVGGRGQRPEVGETGAAGDSGGAR